MTRPPLAIAAILALAAAASACAPQCTCPAAVPAPAAGPPPVANPMPAPAPGTAQPAPAPAPAAGVRLRNEGPAVRRMRSAYPAHLLAGGTRGDVTLDLTLDEDGRVQSAVDVSANNDQFRGPALTIAQELRFSAPPPGVSTVRVRMRFQPAGSSIDVVP